MDHASGREGRPRRNCFQKQSSYRNLIRTGLQRERTGDYFYVDTLHTPGMRRAVDRRHATRAVLSLGVAVGLFVPLYFVALADTTPFAWDFRAYHHAAELAAAGEPFVGAWAPVGHGRWVYPPVTVFGFLPLAALPLWSAYLVMTGVQVAATLLLAGVTLRAIETTTGRLPRLDRALVVAFFLASTYSVAVLGQGQVDPVVALTLALALAWVHGGRPVAAGAAAGLAAVVKLFPVVIGLYFLRVRSYRAVAAAVVTGVTATLAGVAAVGLRAHREYIALLVHERSRLDELVGGVDPGNSALTLSRPIGALAPGVDPVVYPAIAAVALLPVLAVAYLDVATVVDRAVAVLATFGVALLVSPGSNAHHLFYLYPPLLVVLYATRGHVHRLFAAGTAVLLCPLQPAVVADALAAGGASPAVREAVTEPLAIAVGTASVPLCGVLVVLAGCASHAARRRARPQPAPASGD